jgi:pyruvyltransferase
MAQPGDILCGVGGFEDQYAMPLRLLVLAVRGPRTARQLNCTVDMYGDAGLLLPAVYNPPTAQPVYGWGLVPHYVDYEQAVKEPPAGVRIIPTSLPVDRFVDELRACQRVMSSSLHGLVVAEAYGIPAVRVAFSTSGAIRSFGYKHADYYEGTGRCLPAAVTVQQARKLAPEANQQVLHHVRQFEEYVRRKIRELI